MCIHRVIALKSASTYIVLFYIKRLLNKMNFNTKSSQNIHQDAANCTFFQNFLGGKHAPSMCAADIIISILK